MGDYDDIELGYDDDDDDWEYDCCEEFDQWEVKKYMKSDSNVNINLSNTIRLDRLNTQTANVLF